MIGLLKKDVMSFSGQTKIYLLVILLYGVFSFFSKDASMFSVLVSLFGAMYVVTAMAYDEKSGWNKYALTMPVSRDDIVIAKYLLGALFTACAFILNIVMAFAVAPGNLLESIYQVLPFAGIALFYIAVVLPILFKLGVEKGRMMMLVAFFAPTILFLFIKESGINLDWLTEDLLNRIIPFTPVFIVLLLIGSAWLSCRIFRKKEL